MKSTLRAIHYTFIWAPPPRARQITLLSKSNCHLINQLLPVPMLDLFKIGIQILNPSILGFFKLIRRVDWGKFSLHALIGGPTSSFSFFF